MQSKRGPEIELEVQDPLPMLYWSCASSHGLSELVAKAAAAVPPTPAQPWNMILYIDEILPGNQLAYKSARKMWCCYWSVLEFGSAALAHEELTERHLLYLSAARSL